eukprot:2403900-Pleurochrysis_carterae.AAC.2
MQQIARKIGRVQWVFVVHCHDRHAEGVRERQKAVIQPEHMLVSLTALHRWVDALSVKSEAAPRQDGDQHCLGASAVQYLE